MRIRDIARDEQALRYFTNHKVLTLAALAGVLECSHITAHRRLREWKALTSYTAYGRYHTLPTVPTFNSHGIWRYGDIWFSRYGTLKQTVIALVRKSPEGMDHSQLEQLLGVNPKHSLAQYAHLPGIQREQHRGRIIYYSDDCRVYAKQKRRRMLPAPSAKQLPDDAAAVLVLVTRIQHPKMGAEAIAEHLRQQGHHICAERIAELFRHYGIDKKKRI